MPELPAASVFTVAEATDAGWTASALKNAVRHGRLVRLRRGVYSSAPATPAVAARALTCAHPTAVISHRSAALLHNLPVLGRPPDQTEVTVRPRGNTDIPDAHVHRATLRLHEITVVDDAPVTSVARTVIDAARHSRTWPAVATIDAALNRRLTSEDELAEVLSFCWNWPGIRRAQRAVRLSDARAESPLESISRLVIPRLGLPAPQPQVEIADASGRVLARGDFYWDEFGVVGEADGRGKYDERDVLTAEKVRQERLEDLGLVVVRWGWAHVTSTPTELRRKLETAFERGRRRDRSGFPRQWTL